MGQVFRELRNTPARELQRRGRGRTETTLARVIESERRERSPDAGSCAGSNQNLGRGNRAETFDSRNRSPARGTEVDLPLSLISDPNAASNA